MTFAEKLRMCRRQAGMSQEKLAEKLGVSRQAITKWETGTGMPDIENIMAISALFGISIDELLPAAVDVIFETGQASVSMLQRRLKLGYSRAARLVDQMEERGIVGPLEGSKPRQLLITRAQWQEMQMGGAAAPEEEDAPWGEE